MAADPIRDSDISVVVQGPMTAGTVEVAGSVRAVLPGAELVVSTWKGADLGGLDADRVVENDDPGAVRHLGPDGKRLANPNNTNRMIVSTLSGLRAATRPYALKLRNDTPLVADSFKLWFSRFPARNPELRLLQERILVCSVYVRSSEKNAAFLYHPSDTVHFGLRRDLLDVWDVPLAPEPDTTRWFETRPRPARDLTPWVWQRYHAEQILWVGFLRKHTRVDFDYHADARPGARERSDLALVNNAVVLEPWQFGVRMAKFEDQVRDLPLDDLMTFEEWKRHYQRWCVAADG